jgi:hypothetical protein
MSGMDGKFLHKLCKYFEFYNSFLQCYKLAACIWVNSAGKLPLSVYSDPEVVVF